MSKLILEISKLTIAERIKLVQEILKTISDEIGQSSDTDLTEEQTEELRKLLIEFRFKLLNEHVQKVAEEKGISVKDIDAASNEHCRTPYKGKPNNQK